MGYLILSRKANQEIVCRLGSVEIRVMVTEIRGDKVRIGIQAPREVTVNRHEIQEEIDAEKRAKGNDPGDPNGEDYA